MKWLMEPAMVVIGIIVAIVIIVLFVDVGLHMQQSQPSDVNLPPSFAPETLPPSTLPTTTEETTPPTTETTPPTPTPVLPSTWAKATVPIVDPEYHVLPYYSTVYNPAGNLPPVIFQQSYVFNYQYEAVLVNVVKAPLVIDFAVSPGSDSPIRSFFMLTVRDNATQKLLAQDGYFRTYSSNSPKRLYFSFPGTFHINMYGSFVSASLTLRAPTP